eukprot:Tbor_TRINITY_DN5582_c0_g1::TRINITY_DN5582_c0_g1_i5::g.12585::m.12585/K19684/CLUAP1, DYF3; clusterin-associated protein 1
MSFREVRTFTEIMRLLGYPRIISVQSFITPNIELVADILYFLTKRYEPSSEIIYNIELESDRVLFFCKSCEIILNKGRIKLNIKKLYQGDGHAVQELLKLAKVMILAMKARNNDEEDYNNNNNNNNNNISSLNINRNHEESKLIRKLCTELTDDGSSLYFLLEKEILNRNNRTRIMSRATEINEFERRLREMLIQISTEIEELNNNIINNNADSTNLEQKVESKRAQYDRAQKRLLSLMKVKPAFMEEYDKYEEQLQTNFISYLEHYRNLGYLENELMKYNKREDEILEAQEIELKLMRERLRREELQVLRLGGNNNNNNINNNNNYYKENGIEKEVIIDPWDMGDGSGDYGRYIPLRSLFLPQKLIIIDATYNISAGGRRSYSNIISNRSIIIIISFIFGILMAQFFNRKVFEWCYSKKRRRIRGLNNNNNNNINNNNNYYIGDYDEEEEREMINNYNGIDEDD